MINLTQSEWDRIAADGRGVLFREGQHACAVPRPGEVHDGVLCRNYLPPAEFVEASQACETCHGTGFDLSPDKVARGFFAAIDAGVGSGASIPHITCPDCHDGKRRIAAVVPCPTCSIEQDGRIKPGLELCTRCVPRHWLFCSTCTVWSDDEFTITSEAGFVTVGHVVVTWGPRRLVARSDPMESRALLDVAVVMDRVLSFVTDRGTVATIPLPPDIDPQSLVGQYAIGIKVVE